MYLGIDLGTSNSAIAGYRGGRLDLYKAVSGEDVLPSVVMRDRTGGRFVGRRAYNQLQVSPEGIAARFKRLLGTATVLPFGDAGETITPEEASAEVLRQLVKQARTQIGDIDINGTVITVPAAFNQMQSEATIRAATLAGLDRVGLLQEPIAAALACLERPGNKTGLFLVYDLGGGTFDVALVRAIDGAVSIEAHEGVNMLGGTDFDRMLVDSVVRPWLAENFNLPGDLSTDPALRRLITLATANAELAKVELSSAEQAIIFVAEHDARVTDRDGKPVFIEIVVDRAMLEKLVVDRIAASIDLCRSVISARGYTTADIDRVVLIGGPSRMPIVRRMIPAELGIAADLDIDPMTAVARGAAIYAESREWSADVAGVKQARVRAESGNAISYDFESRTSRERARIRVVGTPEAAAWRVAAASSDGRDYGERGVGEAPVFAIDLGAGETCVRMTVTDEAGAVVESACADLVVVRVAAAAAGAPCTSTIAVKVEDTDGKRSVNILDALVTKGEVLPRSGTKSLRAARELVPGVAEWIDVELFEQADGVPEPEANLLVGAFRLSGEDLPLHARPVRIGDPVVLHWSVDDSQLIRCSIELPDHGLHLRDHSFYVDDLGMVDFASEGRVFASRALTAAEEAFEATAMPLRAHCPDELAVLDRRLVAARNRINTVDDADGFRSITEEARLLQQALSRLRHRPDLRADVLRHDLIEADARAREHTASLSADQLAQIGQHKAMAEAAIRDGRFQIASRAIEAIEAIAVAAHVQRPEFAFHHYRWLREQRAAALDVARFDALVAQGDMALVNGDGVELRSIISRIYAVMPRTTTPSTDATALAGLRR